VANVGWQRVSKTAGTLALIGGALAASDYSARGSPTRTSSPRAIRPCLEWIRLRPNKDATWDATITAVGSQKLTTAHRARVVRCDGRCIFSATLI